jgi:ring-1,2-phenylacetyl-CoA epoxidase subunit PaaE
MTPHFHTLTVSDIRRETQDTVSIAFAVPDGLRDAYRFAHGQYLTLKAMLDGEDIRRSYSICTGIDDDDLRVAVKRVDGGRFSRFANELLKVGDPIEVMTPMGRFTAPLEAGEDKSYLAIACGSGITPVMSIIRTVLTREPESRVTLIYGNRNASSVIFKAALEDLKDRFLGRLSVHHVLSREASDFAVSHGHIDSEKIEILTRHMARNGEGRFADHAFLCGPQAMIEEARATLERLGMPHDRVHSELFTTDGVVRKPAPARKPDLSNGLPLAIRLDGALHSIAMDPTETVVDAALRHGLDLPYSCRGGMCCTCRAKLIAGDVAMDQNFSLEPWEIEAGFVLTCQSRPKPGTEAVSVDFDFV